MQRNLRRLHSGEKLPIRSMGPTTTHGFLGLNINIFYHWAATGDTDPKVAGREREFDVRTFEARIKKKKKRPRGGCRLPAPSPAAPLTVGRTLNQHPTTGELFSPVHATHGLAPQQKALPHKRVLRAVVVRQLRRRRSKHRRHPVASPPANAFNVMDTKRVVYLSRTDPTRCFERACRPTALCTAIITKKIRSLRQARRDKISDDRWTDASVCSDRMH